MKKASPLAQETFEKRYRSYQTPGEGLSVVVGPLFKVRPSWRPKHDSNDLQGVKRVQAVPPRTKTRAKRRFPA